MWVVILPNHAISKLLTARQFFSSLLQSNFK